MKQSLAQLRNFILTLNKKSTALISFFLLILIIILFVIQSRLSISSAPPTAFLFSNVTSGSATASYITAAVENTCLILVSRGWPDLKFACDRDKKRVHNLKFSQLRQDTDYQGLIVSFSQLRTWTIVTESVGNRLADVTFAKIRLPILHTASKDELTYQNSSESLVGTVVDSDQVIQVKALVVLLNGDKRISTYTNENGRFSLVIPVDWVGENAYLLVWSESGYVELPQPLSIAVGQAQTIEIKPYEF